MSRAKQTENDSMKLNLLMKLTICPASIRLESVEQVDPMKVGLVSLVLNSPRVELYIAYENNVILFWFICFMVWPSISLIELFIY